MLASLLNAQEDVDTVLPDGVGEVCVRVCVCVCPHAQKDVGTVLPDVGEGVCVCDCMCVRVCVHAHGGPPTTLTNHLNCPQLTLCRT